MTASSLLGSKPHAIAGKVTGILPFTNNLGKLWHGLLFLRALILAIESDAYANPITCATGQPLCQSVCAQQFMPISILNVWTSQLAITGVLAIGFAYRLTAPTRNIKLLTMLKTPDKAQYMHPSVEAAKIDKIAELEGKYYDDTIRQKFTDGVMVVHTKTTKIAYACLQLVLLTIETLFLMVTMWVLKQQYHTDTGWTTLLKSGKLFATPPSYVCKISASKFLNDEVRQQARGLDPVNPEYPFWKATHACAQADPICSVPNFYEMTVTNYFMIVASVLAMTVLALNSVQSLYIILAACMSSTMSSCQNHFKSPTV